jgi:hypothetical protein
VCFSFFVLPRRAASSSAPSVRPCIQLLHEREPLFTAHTQAHAHGHEHTPVQTNLVGSGGVQVLWVLAAVKRLGAAGPQPVLVVLVEVLGGCGRVRVRVGVRVGVGVGVGVGVRVRVRVC